MINPYKRIKTTKKNRPSLSKISSALEDIKCNHTSLKNEKFLHELVKYFGYQNIILNTVGKENEDILYSVDLLYNWACKELINSVIDTVISEITVNSLYFTSSLGMLCIIAMSSPNTNELKAIIDEIFLLISAGVFLFCIDASTDFSDSTDFNIVYTYILLMDSISSVIMHTIFFILSGFDTLNSYLNTIQTSAELNTDLIDSSKTHFITDKTNKLQQNIELFLTHIIDIISKMPTPLMDGRYGLLAFSTLSSIPFNSINSTSVEFINAISELKSFISIDILPVLPINLYHLLLYADVSILQEYCYNVKLQCELWYDLVSQSLIQNNSIVAISQLPKLITKYRAKSQFSIRNYESISDNYEAYFKLIHMANTFIDLISTKSTKDVLNKIGRFFKYVLDNNLCIKSVLRHIIIAMEEVDISDYTKIFDNLNSYFGTDILMCELLAYLKINIVCELIDDNKHITTNVQNLYYKCIINEKDITYSLLNYNTLYNDTESISAADVKVASVHNSNALAINIKKVNYKVSIAKYLVTKQLITMDKLYSYLDFTDTELIYAGWLFNNNKTQLYNVSAISNLITEIMNNEYKIPAITSSMSDGQQLSPTKQAIGNINNEFNANDQIIKNVFGLYTTKLSNTTLSNLCMPFSKLELAISLSQNGYESIGDQIFNKIINTSYPLHQNLQYQLYIGSKINKLVSEYIIIEHKKNKKSPKNKQGKCNISIFISKLVDFIRKDNNYAIITVESFLTIANCLETVFKKSSRHEIISKDHELLLEWLLVSLTMLNLAPAQSAVAFNDIFNYNKNDTYLMLQMRLAQTPIKDECSDKMMTLLDVYFLDVFEKVKFIIKTYTSKIKAIANLFYKVTEFKSFTKKMSSNSIQNSTTIGSIENPEKLFEFTKLANKYPLLFCSIVIDQCKFINNIWINSFLNCLLGISKFYGSILTTWICNEICNQATQYKKKPATSLNHYNKLLNFLLGKLLRRYSWLSSNDAIYWISNVFIKDPIEYSFLASTISTLIMQTGSCKHISINEMTDAQKASLIVGPLLKDLLLHKQIFQNTTDENTLNKTLWGQRQTRTSLRDSLFNNNIAAKILSSLNYLYNISIYATDITEESIKNSAYFSNCLNHIFGFLVSIPFCQITKNQYADIIVSRATKMYTPDTWDYLLKTYSRVLTYKLIRWSNPIAIVNAKSYNEAKLQFFTQTIDNSLLSLFDNDVPSNIDKEFFILYWFLTPCDIAETKELYTDYVKKLRQGNEKDDLIKKVQFECEEKDKLNRFMVNILIKKIQTAEFTSDTLILHMFVPRLIATGEDSAFVFLFLRFILTYNTKADIKLNLFYIVVELLNQLVIRLLGLTFEEVTNMSYFVCQLLQWLDKDNIMTDTNIISISLCNMSSIPYSKRHRKAISELLEFSLCKIAVIYQSLDDINIHKKFLTFLNLICDKLPFCKANIPILKTYVNTIITKYSEAKKFAFQYLYKLENNSNEYASIFDSASIYESTINEISSLLYNKSYENLLSNLICQDDNMRKNADIAVDSLIGEDRLFKNNNQAIGCDEINYDNKNNHSNSNDVNTTSNLLGDTKENIAHSYENQLPFDSNEKQDNFDQKTSGVNKHKNSQTEQGFCDINKPNKDYTYSHDQQNNKYKNTSVKYATNTHYNGYNNNKPINQNHHRIEYNNNDTTTSPISNNNSSNFATYKQYNSYSYKRYKSNAFSDSNNKPDHYDYKYSQNNHTNAKYNSTNDSNKYNNNNSNKFYNSNYTKDGSTQKVSEYGYNQNTIKHKFHQTQQTQKHDSSRYDYNRSKFNTNKDNEYKDQEDHYSNYVVPPIDTNYKYLSDNSKNIRTNKSYNYGQSNNSNNYYDNTNNNYHHKSYSSQNSCYNDNIRNYKKDNYNITHSNNVEYVQKSKPRYQKFSDQNDTTYRFNAFNSYNKNINKDDKYHQDEKGRQLKHSALAALNKNIT